MNHPRRSLGDPRGAAERMSLFSVFAVNLLLPATLLSAAAHMLSSALCKKGGGFRGPLYPVSNNSRRRFSNSRACGACALYLACSTMPLPAMRRRCKQQMAAGTAITPSKTITPMCRPVAELGCAASNRLGG